MQSEDAPRERSPEIRALQEDGSDEARGALLAILSTTADPVSRNAAALALSDLGESRLLEATADLLRDPRTQGARGTLLYALTPFDTRPLALLLVDIATSGAFEASREAFALLTSMCGPLSDADEAACETLARDRLAAADDPELRAWRQAIVRLFDGDVDG